MHNDIPGRYNLNWLRLDRNSVTTVAGTAVVMVGEVAPDAGVEGRIHGGRRWHNAHPPTGKGVEKCGPGFRLGIVSDKTGPLNSYNEGSDGSPK